MIINCLFKNVIISTPPLRQSVVLRYLIVWLLLFGNDLRKTETFEPVTTTVVLSGVAVSLLSSAYWATKCKFYECCDDRSVSLNVTGLQSDLDKQLHGQHLVASTVIKSLRGHFSNPQPSKALVLSFHGGTGSGKNFVSRIIANNIYHEGMKSEFVHLIIATHHFPHEDKTEIYKDELRQWVKGNVSACSRSLFIFDEMDKMPIGLIGAIKPFIDHYQEIDGIDFRKSIFIFLSNTGGQSITAIALEQWKEAKKREDLELKDLENSVTLGAYNEGQGGLWHSSLIEKNLISAFVPFLPLERQHVKLCIRDDLRTKNQTVTEDVVNRVADMLQYYPTVEPVYCKSGCKRVSQKVDLALDDEP